MRTRFAVAAVVAVAMVAAGARAEESLWAQHQHYAGFIDGKIAVSMELSVDGGKAKGTYQYAIAGKDLNLDGTTSQVDPIDHQPATFRLTESADGNKTTGTFRLEEDEFTGALTGTWTSGDGKRVLEVGLAKIADGRNLVGQKPKEYSVRTEYLEFPERNDFLQALNTQLKAGAQRGQAALLKEAIASASDRAKSVSHYEWEAIVEPAVTYADASLISIKTLHWAYTGGAHGNTNFTAANYVWRAGALVELELGELLEARPATYEALTKALVKNLKGQKASAANELVLDKNHPPTLNVTRAGLLFTFDPYAVGAYAEGAYNVVIPWKEAAEFIPAASPLQRLMNPAKAPTTPAAPPRQVRETPMPSEGGGEFPRPG